MPRSSMTNAVLHAVSSTKINNRVTRLLRQEYPRIYYMLVSDISRNKCPVCGRKFGNRGALYMHLLKNLNCQPLFYDLLEMMTDRAPEHFVIEKLEYYRRLVGYEDE